MLCAVHRGILLLLSFALSTITVIRHSVVSFCQTADLFVAWIFVHK